MQTTAGPEESVEAEKPRRPLRRLLLWAGVVLGVLLLAAVAVYWIRRSQADDTITRHRKKFAEESKRLAAIPRGRPAIEEPAAEGTAEGVRAAFVTAVNAIPWEERRHDFRSPFPEDQERNEPLLAANAGIVVPLAPLLAVPSRPVLPPLRFQDDETVTVASDTAKAMEWLAALSRRALARGEREEALRLALFQVVAGSDCARTGTVMWFTIGNGIEDRGLRGLRDVLASGPLSMKDARRILRVMDALDASRPTLAMALDVEREVFRGSWSAMPEGDAPFGAGWRHLWSFRIWLAANLDVWDGVADRMRENAILGLRDVDRARDEAKRLDEAQADFLLVRMMTVVQASIVENDAGSRAMRAVARTATALAAHRAEKGDVPAALSGLVPAYLTSAPVDPFDGKPLRWSREKATVWSIGRDGKDDGGVAGGEVEDDMPDNEGDVAWTLWNGR